MSVDASDITQIVASGKPVLCIDTCSLLDVMRDVTRETVLAANAESGLELLAAAEDVSLRLWVLIAQQVRSELVDREQGVQDEADKNLKRFREQAARVDHIAGIYGAQGTIDTAHLTGHVGAARAVFERWKLVGRDVATSHTALQRAFIRVNKGEAPASIGNQSMKDCVIVESYLEAMRDLRAGGMQANAVMLSSNTKDYGGAALVSLRAPLAADFAAVQMDFAADHRYAKHLLGL
jgi:hypothetical protein